MNVLMFIIIAIGMLLHLSSLHLKRAPVSQRSAPMFKRAYVPPSYANEPQIEPAPSESTEDPVPSLLDLEYVDPSKPMLAPHGSARRVVDRAIARNRLVVMQTERRGSADVITCRQSPWDAHRTIYTFTVDTSKGYTAYSITATYPDPKQARRAFSTLHQRIATVCRDGVIHDIYRTLQQPGRKLAANASMRDRDVTLNVRIYAASSDDPIDDRGLALRPDQPPFGWWGAPVHRMHHQADSLGYGPMLQRTTTSMPGMILLTAEPSSMTELPMRMGFTVDARNGLVDASIIRTCIDQRAARYYAWYVRRQFGALALPTNNGDFVTRIGDRTIRVRILRYDCNVLIYWQARQDPQLAG